MPKYNKCRWRGKLVSECVYSKHIAIEKAREKRKTERAEETITETAKAETQNKYDECRILNLQSISKQLWCISCKQCLSFDFIENEERKGLGSIFTIRCHKCLLLNRVTSGPVHSVDRTHDRFDINSNVITGCIHSGIGYTKLNKILACMNIPTISWTTYKRYEEEVGNAAIKTAKDSCPSAAKLERQLTIENAKEIEQLMSEEFKTGFIIKEGIVSFDDVIRAVFSYDMGWTTRGNGKAYDSHGGYGCLVGKQGNKILDFETFSRKYNKCDRGHAPPDHDCPVNLYGSAKAAEPFIANKLSFFFGQKL